MQISVTLMGMLKEKTPAGGVLELPDGATIVDALAALGLAVDRRHVTTINGKIERDRVRTLSDGDELTILPPVGGG